MADRDRRNTFVERRKKSKCSKFILRFLGAAIFILGVLLIIQIIIVITASRKHIVDVRSQIIDGKYVKTITSCGFIQGFIENDGFSFLGIPYAVPPIKDRRWKMSKVHSTLEECWNGTYMALERRKPCWQFFRNGSYDGSESCLHLDIFSPKLFYDSPVNVVVFISGDTLDGGESFDIQPSAQLAKQRNCLFVSVSIRRSVLGFLSLKILSESSSSTVASGNYGLSDVLTSLLWVKYNIRHFGGNPESVTLLTHQSGSSLVAALLTSGFKTDLFHQVWMSGGHVPNKILSLEEADKQNEDFLEYTECATAECLYKLSPEELLESVPYKWRTFNRDLPSPQEIEHEWLVKDGHVLRKSVFDKSKSFDDIPIVVVGAPMHVDATAEMRNFLDWNSTGKYREYLDGKFDPQFASEVIRHYYRPDLNNWQQFSSLLSDMKTICPLLKWTSKYFASNNKAFFYIAKHKIRTHLGNLALINSDINAILGLSNLRAYKDKKFESNMATLFYNFVYTGSLSMNGDSESQKLFFIDDRIVKASEYSNCELWNRDLTKESFNSLQNETLNIFD